MNNLIMRIDSLDRILNNIIINLRIHNKNGIIDHIECNRTIYNIIIMMDKNRNRVMESE